MPDKKQESWKHGIAGCTAGLVSVLVLHPLDVIKTRLQVQDGIQGVLPAYRGTVDAVRCILVEEGWQSLYKGLTPALLGAGVSWGLYFTAYNHAKQRWQRWGGDDVLNPVHHLLAAAEGGAVTSLITNPIWVVKTRLQLQKGMKRTKLAVPAGETIASTVPYKGLIDGIQRIAKEEGIRGLYRGLGPSLIMVSHGAIQFMVYEELKRQLKRRKTDHKQLSSLEITLVGAASKLFATVSTYPFSVVRARLQQKQQSGRAVLYNDSLTTLRLIVRREGVGGLYKGIVPNIMRVLPSSALTLLVYEKLMQQMMKLDFGEADNWQVQ